MMEERGQQVKKSMSTSQYVPVFDCGSTLISNVNTVDSGMNIFDPSKYSAHSTTQWKVPKLDVSRSRSFSRQSSCSSLADLDCTNSSINSVISNTPKDSYSHRVAFPAPLPKPQRTTTNTTAISTSSSQTLQNVKEFINGTHNSLYNSYAIPPQPTRIHRSQSGSSITDFFPQQQSTQLNQQQQQQQQQYQQQQQQHHSQYALQRQPLTPFLNVYQQRQVQESYIPFVVSAPAISPQTSNLINEFKKQKLQIRKDFEGEAEFERSVQSNLRELQYLGTRKQDIMKDCISDLEELYSKYKKDDFSLAEELLSSRRSLRLETSGYEDSIIHDQSVDGEDGLGQSQSRFNLNESNLHDDFSVISDV